MLAGGFGRVESASSRMANANTAIIGVSAAAAYGLVNLGKSALYAAGQQSRVLVGFETILKSKKAADELQKQVLAFDIKSPFNYIESAQGAQMLLASGMNAKKLMETMYGVGNATVAAGGGTEKFNRALAVMAKISSSGTLTKVRMNQFAAAGIPAQEILKKQLGLTGEQMANIGKLHLKADVVIDALNKGFSEEFKGGLEKAANTYLGALDTLAGTKGKLLMNIGHAIEADAVGSLKWVTHLTEATAELVSHNPGLTRLAFGFTAIAALSGGIYGTVRAIQMATLARKALQIAVEKDTVAEQAKTIVATEEAAAIAASGNAATGTAGKLGMLSRLKMFGAGAGGLGGQAIFQGGSRVAASSAFGGGSGLTGVLGSAGAGFGGPITYAGAGMSLGLGAVAGVSASNNMQAAGYTQGQSYMYGAATGIGAAGAAMFLPGGAVAVVIGEAAAYGINELYNKPMEAAAEKGTGAEGDLLARQNAASKGVSIGENGARQKLAAVYDELAANAKDAGDELQALSYTTQAANQRTQAAKDAADPARQAARARAAAGRAMAASGETEQSQLAKDGAEQQRKIEAMNLSYVKYDNGTISGGRRNTNINNGIVDPRAGAVKSNRDGSRSVTLHLPESRGDAHARKANYNTRTPSPNYAN